MSALSETRATDRMAMSLGVVALAVKHGAVAHLEKPEPGASDYRVDIKAARGLRVTVEFERRSVQPNIYVLGWNVHYGSGARLADVFAPGHVNPYHRQKATSVAFGFDQLCAELVRCLTLARTGAAFESSTQGALT